MFLLSLGCTRDFHIMFVMDASGSIGGSNFEIMKAFVANVIRSLNSSADSKVGVIRFSDNAQVVIPLQSTQDANGLATQVLAVGYTGSGTNTHTALGLMVTELLAANVDSAAPIGILITDGRSNSPDLTLEAAGRVHAEGISMYTFGIGNTNDEELQAIASAPFYEYSFYISSFNATGFDQRVLLLTRQTCSSGFCMPVHVYASYNYTCHKDTIYTVHVILHVYVIIAL